MYEAITKQIRISVTPEYLNDQSDPADDRYFWSYRISIENLHDAICLGDTPIPSSEGGSISIPVFHMHSCPSRHFCSTGYAVA